MNRDHDRNIDDLELRLALRRLADTSDVPPPDPAREAALMAAFDTARSTRFARSGQAPVALQARRGQSKHVWWGMAGFAAAAATLIVVGLGPVARQRSGPKPPVVSERSESNPPSDFVMVPGAAALPDMESGSLVRIDLPVSMLPSLGVTPPAGSRAKVRADLIVAQDGLPRAVRLVN